MSYLKTLTAVDHASAQGLQKELLDTAKKQVGFIPNMYANMVNAPGVLSTYLHGYGLFRVTVRRTPFLRRVDEPGSIRGVAHHDGVHLTR
ncbi:hypothetical protein RCH06_002492, partial [Polaromonas sp. CG_9.5]|nr:hypothetical protein [Polaromonas sp. CG_9.5]